MHRLGFFGTLKQNLGDAWKIVAAICLVMFLRAIVGQAFLTFMPVYYVQQGFSMVSAGFIFSIFITAGTFGTAVFAMSLAIATLIASDALFAYSTGAHPCIFWKFVLFGSKFLPYYLRQFKRTRQTAMPNAQLNLTMIRKYWITFIAGNMVLACGGWEVQTEMEPENIHL